MVIRAGFTIPASTAIALAACGEEPMPPAACASFPQQTVGVGEEVILEPCFSDPEAGTLTLAARSSNPEVATGEVLGSNVRIAGVSPGTATITVTATDLDMLTAEVAIEVLVPNRPPVLAGSFPSFRLEAGAVLRLVLSEYFVDPDGQELAYDATSSDSRVASVALSADTLLVTGVSRGEEFVTVTATDPGGLSATAPIEVTVTVNRRPIVVKALGSAVVLGDQTSVRVLDEHFSDPDGDELVYAATSSNTSVASVALSADTLTVTGGSLGDATVTVTATDPSGLSVTVELDVRVIDQVLPFRDDFESEASLDNWELRDGIAEVDNGALGLSSTNVREWAVVQRPFLMTDWTATARMRNVTEDSWVQLVLWFSSPNRPANAYALQIGRDPDNYWRQEDTDTNWRLLELLDGGWKVMVSGKSGPDEAEFVEITLSHVGRELSATIGDSVVFSNSDITSGSRYFVSRLALAEWPVPGATGPQTGFFDWVEVNGVAVVGAEVAGVRPSLREWRKHDPFRTVAGPTAKGARQ